MPQEKPEPTQFPVDAGPVLRAVGILVTILVGLCVLVYLQSGGKFYGAGLVFLMFVFCFSAYTQRSDNFRMTSILVGGALLCIAMYFLGGPTDEPAAPTAVQKSPKSSASKIAPKESPAPGDNEPEGLTD